MDYRKKLEKERDKISKTIKEMEDNTLFGDTTKHTSEKYSTGELSSYDNHIGAIGTDVYMQDMDNSLIDHQKYVLNGINEALNKVNDGNYGICSNLKAIVALAHKHNMLALVDEAHGTHFYFNDDLPMSAMEAGADMASVSMHKSGGSLTQSSFLLLGENVNADYVRQVVNLTQTTSGSYLLMASLDMSRKNLAIHGNEIFNRVRRLAGYARTEINQIGDYYAYCKELINGDSVYDFDVTKLSIFTLDIGLAGIEVYDLLRDEYGIQIEFGDIGNILAYISVGDSEANIERLIGALLEIRRRFKKDRTGMFDHEYINPEVVISPQAAFYGEKESLPLYQSIDRVCSEFVMCYPPGIPILAPGERITKEILDYIQYAKEKGCFMTGPEDMAINKLNVLKGR